LKFSEMQSEFLNKDKLSELLKAQLILPCQTLRRQQDLQTGYRCFIFKALFQHTKCFRSCE
jgi:hypothetical protein